ncbi:MAG: 2-oxoacid:acceptor oxidoreductase subunit alpha [Patescibacteria group bacterium]
MNTFNWKVAGLSGEGIMVSGLIFSKTSSRHGFYIFDYTEYPSIITGGHNTYQVHAGIEPVYAQKEKLDLLLAMNANALVEHLDELTSNSLVIFDSSDDKINIAEFNLPCKSLDLPMVKLAKEMGATRLMGNNVGLGASAYLLGLDLEILNSVIHDIFARKGQEVVDLNHKAAKAGYEFARNAKAAGQLGNWDFAAFEKQEYPESRVTFTGNEAVALGSVAGGLKLFAAYPMTPSSSVLHYLAAHEDKAGIVVKHAEDEISAINMALGASFTGVRSMTSTSGGGFAYMTEALGLSGVSELPLVVFESMRPGPALGMPTWTAQGDLQFVVTASQDEFPRFVFAPGDAQEAFEMAKLSQELAEKYQGLVILLSDKYLSESRYTAELAVTKLSHERHGFNQNPVSDETGFYPRYKIDKENAISMRSVPGQQGGEHINNSYEHDEYGLATEESQMRISQMDKRKRKLKLMKSEIPQQFYSGSLEDEITFISFGSTKGPLLEAQRQLAANGKKVGVLNLTWLSPFPIEQVSKVIKESKRVVVVEGNQCGQLANLITQETGIKLEENYRRYDGRPFYAEEIIKFINK